MATPAPPLVLVLGATSHVGLQTVAALRHRGDRVAALLSPDADARALEALGAEVVRGDLLQPASLPAAFAAAEAVVLCSKGVMHHEHGASAHDEVIGGQNAVEAALRAHARRFVLLSVIACDDALAATVPHVAAKAALERFLRARGVPFVAVRAGCILDQEPDVLAAGIRRRSLSALWDPELPLAWTYTPDLAEALAAAVHADDAAVLGQSLDCTLTQPLSLIQLAALASQLLQSPVRIARGGAFLRNIALPAASLFSSRVRGERALYAFFSSGRCLPTFAGVAAATTALGQPPQPAEAVERYLCAIGELKRRPAYELASTQ